MDSCLATASLVSPSATGSDTARSVAVRLSQPTSRRLGSRRPGRTPRARNCGSINYPPPNPQVTVLIRGISDC